MNGETGRESTDEISYRRAVRREYQELISKTQQCAPDDDDFLSESFRQADVLLTKVSKPREAVYDSTLVNIQASIIKAKTHNLQANLTEFKPEEFASKFVIVFNKKVSGSFNEQDYAEAFQEYGLRQDILSTTPSFFPLYSTFEKTDLELPKKVRQTRKKDQISKEVEKPQSVEAAALEKGDDEATAAAERILRMLHKVCGKNKGPVCYFSFLTNPFSFTETIENMFYASILAKEGAIEIGLDTDGIPFIEPMTPDETRNVQRHGTFSQNIMSITRQDFENICSSFNITEPIITRKRMNASSK